MTPKGTREERRIEVEDEQKFAPLFTAAIKKIDTLESESNSKKIEVVKDLAHELEKAGFPVERIANEIVHVLRGKISPTHIRESLDSKYKDVRQSTNAKKRSEKVATEVLPTKPINTKQDAPVKEVAPTVKSGGTNKTEYIDINNADDVARSLGIRKDSINLSQKFLKPISALDDVEVKGTPRESTDNLADITEHTPQQQDPIIATQQQPQLRQVRLLLDWDKLQELLGKVHHKDIKNFWLCGRVDANNKLIDMNLEREQSLQVVNQ